MRLDSNGWRTFFDSYQREAFRLETLPFYGVCSEQAMPSLSLRIG